MPSYILKDPDRASDYKRADFVYRYRAGMKALNPDNIPEWLAYKVFGPDLIGSLALALDPLGPYRFPQELVTPANRTRKGVSIGGRARNHQYRTYTNYKGLNFQKVRYEFSSYPPVGPPVARTAQLVVPCVSHDTTVRSRAISSRQGTFDSFRITHMPSSRHYLRDGLTQRQWTGDMIYHEDSTIMYEDYDGGGCCRILPSDVELFRTSEFALADMYINKYWKRLLLQAVPTRRRFDVGYNLYELKDIPRMLKSTVGYLKDLQSVQGLGNQFLNLEFGWEQTLRTVKDIMLLPTAIARKVNYLLSRRGKATTFRSALKFVDTSSGSLPPIVFDPLTWETITKAGTVSCRRNIDLRLVTNVNVEFPNVKVPALRESLLQRMWGLDPTPATVYNAVPWTWLIDWFSDMGDYIDLIDAVNYDEDLINFGFITYQSSGVFGKTPEISWARRYLESRVGTVLYDTGNVLSYYQIPLEYRFRHTVRKDLSAIGSLKSTSTLANLAGDQLAILGALLAKRA